MGFWQLTGCDKRDILTPNRHMHWIREALYDPATVVWQAEKDTFIICGGDQAMLVEQLGRFLLYTFLFISLSPANIRRYGT